MELISAQNTRRTPHDAGEPAGRQSFGQRRSGARGLHGSVSFYPAGNGTLVVAEVFGLPGTGLKAGGKNGVFGFHIHSGSQCTGDETDPFKNTGPHFNPENAEHPWHAGDMPPLFANAGYAFLVFYTDRFTVPEVVGRTVVIHDMPDDFTTQPAGNSGKKIACGVVKANT